jgi:hypothetical protein
VEQDLSEHLAAHGIELAAETESHYLLARGDCIALVERHNHTMGSTGVLTENGLAYLIWRDGRGFLKSKLAEIPASPRQIADIARFSQDLAAALR